MGEQCQRHCENINQMAGNGLVGGGWADRREKKSMKGKGERDEKRKEGDKGRRI